LGLLSSSSSSSPSRFATTNRSGSLLLVRTILGEPSTREREGEISEEKQRRRRTRRTRRQQRPKESPREGGDPQRRE
jgi:hypothetical protein